MTSNNFTEDPNVHKPQEDLRFKSNREYRSTVFTSYFSIPEHAAQLYEGLIQKYDLTKAGTTGGVARTGTWNSQEFRNSQKIQDSRKSRNNQKLQDSQEFRNGQKSQSSQKFQDSQNSQQLQSQNEMKIETVKPEDITFETLEGVLYMARKNDLAFNVKNKILVIGEHQSTINWNMPLRGAIYYGRTMEKMIPPKAIYRSSRISIPTPEFYVFYNGKEPQPLEQTLRLSDSYLEKTDSPMLELKVKVINVNLPAGHPILEKCRPLYEYSWFMWRVREHLRSGEDRDGAIRQAMEDCVRQEIMVGYIQEHGSEVRNMLFTEFNLDDAKEVWEEEAREAGREEGREEGREYKLLELICKKLRKGKSAETIAEELEEEVSIIQDICQIAAAFAPDYNVEEVSQVMKRRSVL